MWLRQAPIVVSTPWRNGSHLARGSAGGRRARVEGGAHVDKSQFDLTLGVDPAPRRIPGIARLGAVTMAFALVLGACGPGSSASPSSASIAPSTDASTAPSASAST